MDRSIPLPPGTVVKLFQRRHVIEGNFTDLLTFRCEQSAWRHELAADDGDGIPCKGCGVLVSKPRKPIMINEDGE